MTFVPDQHIMQVSTSLSSDTDHQQHGVMTSDCYYPVYGTHIYGYTSTNPVWSAVSQVRKAQGGLLDRYTHAVYSIIMDMSNKQVLYRWLLPLRKLLSYLQASP
jgi:hypothetical protein